MAPLRQTMKEKLMQTTDRPRRRANKVRSSRAVTAKSRLKHIRNSLMAGAALALVASVSPAFAQQATYVWSDVTGDGDWYATQNWAPGLPPTGETYESAGI